jgi:hypothetical protein
MHCNALQCTAMHCNTLQCTARHCNALQCTAMHFNVMICPAANNRRHLTFDTRQLQSLDFLARQFLRHFISLIFSLNSQYFSVCSICVEEFYRPYTIHNVNQCRLKQILLAPACHPPIGRARCGLFRRRLFQCRPFWRRLLRRRLLRRRIFQPDSSGAGSSSRTLPARALPAGLVRRGV